MMVCPVWLPVARVQSVRPEKVLVAKSWLCFSVHVSPPVEIDVPLSVPAAVPRWQYSRIRMSPATVVVSVIVNEVVVAAPPTASG